MVRLYCCETAGRTYALQASFQHRFSQGPEFQGNYTLSKCMGNSSGFIAQYGDTNADPTQAGNNHFFFQNTYNPGADYGDWEAAVELEDGVDLPATQGPGRRRGSCCWQTACRAQRARLIDKSDAQSVALGAIAWLNKPIAI